MKKIYLFVSAAFVAISLLCNINSAFAAQGNPVKSSEVLGCPPPTDVFLGKIDYTSAQFYWTAGGDEKSWEVSYGEKGYTEQRLTVTKEEVELTNLKPNVDYVVKIRAVCEANYTSTWVEIPFTTPDYECLPPTDLTADSISSTSAVVNWKPGSLEESWLVFYKVAGAPKWAITQKVRSTNYPIKDLLPSTTYEFCVLASCTNNAKSDSTKFQFTTDLPDSCTAPKNVSVRNITKNSVTIGWTHPEGKARDFSVNYKESTDENWSINLNTSVDSLDIKRLKPNTSYDVQVTANCVNGISSEASEIYTFSTLVDAIDDHAGNNVTIYPNPTTGKLNIDCSNINATNLDIYDIYGRLLNTINVNESNLSIDASQYANGLYFIRIHTDNGLINKTFIKK